MKKLFFFGIILFFLIHQAWGQENPRTGQVEIRNVKDYVYYNGYKHRSTDIPDERVHFFQGIAGPNVSSRYSIDRPAQWTDFSRGNSNRLCIYLVDSVSNWLGLVNGLNAIGVPFRITMDLDDALTHRVIMIYPGISSENLDVTSFNKLRDVPVKGGALIAYNITSPALRKVFGFDGTTVSNTRKKIQLNTSQSQLLLLGGKPFNKTIWINSSKADITPMQSVSYKNPEYRPLASYEDGSAAITQNIYSKGLTLAIGVDLGLLFNTFQGNRLLSIPQFVSNESEPSIDFFFQLIKNVYTNYADFPVLLGTVPNNKSVSILLTHILDSEEEIRTSLLFGDLERSFGSRGTYHVQTKYLKDGKSNAFFHSGNIPYLKALKVMGMEIGSNSVSNTPFFSYIPLGTGTESYPNYRPYCSSEYSSFNETLLGELRVSKYLLDMLLANFTFSFIPGALENPPNLYKGLQATAYKFTSTMVSNEAISRLPYQTVASSGSTVLLDVFEIPITVFDSFSEDIYNQIGLTIHKIDQISRYGGVANIQISCNPERRGLDFEREILDQYHDRAWVGSMSEYGFYLRGRMLTSMDVVKEETHLKIRLIAPYKIDNLPVVLPSNSEYVTHTPRNISIRNDGNVLVIKELKGSMEIVVRY